MANVKITGLAELTTLSPGDLIEVVDDPAGTPASFKMTMLNLVKAAMGLTNSDEFEVRAVLHDETLGAPGRFDVSSISASYDHLLIRVFVRSSFSGTADGVYLLFNNDSTATNYHRQNNGAVGGAASVGAGDDPQIAICPAATSTADDFLIGEILVINYAGSKRKQALANTSHRRDATNSYALQVAMNWESTSAINRISVQPDGYATDNFVADSRLQIIGIKGSG